MTERVHDVKVARPPTDTARMTGPATDAEATERVAALGARDVLVFRRVGAGTWAHVGGVGRGAGWAGIVEATETAEPMLRQVLTDPMPVRVLASASARIIGPYYAGTAVLVRPSEELVVVWGHPERSPPLLAADAAELRRASLDVVDTVSEDSPAKRLGDELEVLHAVQRLTGSLGGSLGETLERVAAVAAEALGSDLVAVWVGSGAFAVSQRGWAADDVPRVADVLSGLGRTAADGIVVHDAATAPLPPPLSPDEGVAAYLVRPFRADVGGGLLAVRRSAAHGFAELDRRVADQVAAAAEVLLGVAQARDVLEGQLVDVRAKLDRDSLTAAASRHSWDTELDHAQALVDAGVPVTVALVDLDELKAVNDSRGHAAGDALLRTAADALTSGLRGMTDVVARLGGDEFGVLVPRAGDADGLARRLRAALRSATTPDGLRVHASVGAAAARPGERLPDVVRRADAAMYAEKRRRRRRA